MSKYDPNKQYKWEESDEFVMNGNQFGLLLNAFRTYLAKPESQEVMLMMKAETEITTLLAKGVESGLVKEIAPEPNGQPEPKPKQRRKKL